MSQVKKTNLKKLTVTSILAAIIVIVSFFPLKTLGLEITFSMVPVAIGAIMYGPSVGAILGGVFGVISFIQCLGYSAFGVTLFGISPIYTFLVCIPTRILAGFLAGVLFKAINKMMRTNIVAALVASLAAPLLNTVFFMSALVLCFYNTDFIQGFVSSMGVTNPFTFIILFVGVNGLVEIICGFVVAFPCSKSLIKYFKL